MIAGHASVVRLAQHWFIACRTRELGAQPRALLLQGTPLVLFRDQAGRAAALLDRCPHRNVPLSAGAIVDGLLQCAYHGWRFDGAGACRLIPTLATAPEGPARRAPAFATREHDGFVWVYATPDVSPITEPFRFPSGSAGYTTIVQVVDAETTLYSALENALDVPHTAFLHRGLFRTESRGLTVTAIVRRGCDRVEAEYVGEARPEGLVARLLSPSGGTVTHFDRFILPSIAQVEYRLGPENHLLVTSALTPLDDFRTRLFNVVSFRLRLPIPGAVMGAVVRPFALRIFRQDAAVLKLQTETIRQFDGEQFASTDVDVLGRHIWRLLKAAGAGEVVPTEDGDLSVVLRL